MGKSQSKPNANTIGGNDVKKKGKSKNSGAISTENGIIGTAQITASALNDNNVATVFASTNAVKTKGGKSGENGIEEDGNNRSGVISSNNTTPASTGETKSTTDDSVTSSDPNAPTTASQNTQAVVHQDVGHSGNLCIDDFELLKVLGKLLLILTL